MTDEITLDAPETRLERFLAAAAGVEGITLDDPETRIEKYLYKIAQGSGGVPPVEDADKGKYLHANESTGDLEWSTAGGSGGGVLVVTCTGSGGNIVVDKKAGEIYAASKVGIVIWINAVPFLSEGEERADILLTADKSNEGYVFTLGNVMFSAASADDYPTFME